MGRGGHRGPSFRSSEPHPRDRPRACL